MLPRINRGPLHSLVLVGETDEIEREVLESFRVAPGTPRRARRIVEDDDVREGES